MLDNLLEIPSSISVQIAKSAERTTPDYLKQFLIDNAPGLVMAIRKGDGELLEGYLKQLAQILPKDSSFREIAAAICVKKNGDVFATCVEGGLEIIDAKKAQDLLDDIVQLVPMDTEQILFIHDHPSEQSPIGPIPASRVGFSDADIDFFTHMGFRLRSFDLEKVFIGLSTANTNKVVLESGENLGRAYGWKFFSDEGPESE